MRVVAMMGFAALLSACAMGPDYSRPDIPVTDSFRMAGEEKDLPSLADMPWWELYRDEELQKLIRISLEENKDLERAVATVKEFEARLFIAKTDYAPQMTATANGPVVRQGGVRFPGFANPFNYYLQGNLAWEIDVWGRIRRSNEAARADLLAREDNRRAIVLQLVGAVAQSYFDLRQFDLQLEIAERTLKAWNESVRISQARHRQGLIDRLDVEQFQAERENAAARIADLKRQMIQKENELSVLLGRNPGPIPRGLSLTGQTMPPVVPAGLPSELLQRRPDIAQAEQQLTAATARIGAAKADRFPKISLTGTLGIANPSLSKLFTPGGDFGVLGPGLTGSLLNAQALGFLQDAAEAQARQAVAQYKQTILVAFKEVEDALAGVSTAREQAAAQERQVNALQAALRLASLRYKGGLANYLDVLIAQRNLFDAELSLASTRRLYLTSVVQLYKALGGGWSPEEQGPAPTTVFMSGSPGHRKEGPMPISKWFPCWLIIGCLLMHSAEATAQQSRPDDEITKLADDVYLFRHQFHQAVFITTPEGVIVTDPISSDAAAWLKTEIKKLTDQPVRYVIYSHHHNDHITGGSVFAKHAIFVSHALARANILQAADPATPVPSLTFTDRLFIDLGGTHVELIYTGKNHSDNSVVVLLPQHKLLFAVDFIPVETVAYRTMKSDYPDDWIESLKKVEQLDFEVLVPGHGKIGRKDHVGLFRGYLEDLRAAVLEHVKQGSSVEETKKTVRLPKYEEWQRYADWFPENVEGMYRHLSQAHHDNP